MDAAARTRRTFACERWRAAVNGILEAGVSTFLLYLAVRHYQAGAVAKSLIAAGGSFGLLTGPLLVSFVAGRGWRATSVAAGFSTMGAVAFLLPTLVPTLPVFVLGSILATTCATVSIPLITHVYQENYPAQERGRLFSRTTVLRIGVAALFSEGAGRWLTHAEGVPVVRALLSLFALCFVVSALCFRAMPGTALDPGAGSHPLRALRYVRTDSLFRHFLIVWMLMGIGNLMMFPLRVDFLADNQHGVPFDAAVIALFTGVLPNVVRLATSRLWGWLFDRANFFALRSGLNVCFALANLFFFWGTEVWNLTVGGILFGLAAAGGDIAWSLWVTKFAPPGRTADYMSVHACFTGLRGVLAPFIGFFLIQWFPIRWVATLAALLILWSSVLLALRWKQDSGRPGTNPLTEDVID